MRIGMLYSYNEKKFDEERKKGKEIELGVSADSLYDDLNELEVSCGYNHTAVVSQLKANLMLVLGKIKPQPAQEEHNQEHKG